MRKSDSTCRERQFEYLAHMHALSSAVSGAISAIENNDLQLLKTHVAAQEVICNRLSSNKGTSAPTSTGKGGNQDQTLQREISQARNALAQLNRVYAALLSRVSDSAQMIIALYRSHGEGYNRGQSALSQHHSWSCEV